MSKLPKIRWAKAVYAPGIDRWYVIIGDRHGEDPMFVCVHEQHAKVKAEHVNKTLSRLVNRRRRP